VALQQTLGCRPEHLNAKAAGALDTTQTAAAAADDRLQDDEGRDERPAVALVEHQPLGERLWQPS